MKMQNPEQQKCVPKSELPVVSLNICNCLSLLLNKCDNEKLRQVKHAEQVPAALQQGRHNGFLSCAKEVTTPSSKL